MGIRHLETFIKTVVPRGHREISVKHECEEFKRINEGQKPVLVIDLMGLVNSLTNDKAIMLCGGRHNEFLKDLEVFFKLLTSFADLVFFEDGPTADHKAKTWMTRQNEKYEKMKNVIEHIRENRPIKFIVRELRDVPMSTTNVEAIEFMAKKYGKLIITTTKECDAELVRYANNEENVLAVVADDSDFLIFSGSWRYWSLRQLNVRTLRTTEYDKVKMKNFLNLDDEQMKVLATLGGNDIINYERLRPFHQRNCGHQAHSKFPWLAGYIRGNLSIDREDLVKKIARDVFGNETSDMKKSIAESLKQYDADFDLPDFSESDPVLHFCQENFYDFNYLVLSGSTKTFTTLYYDMENEDFPEHLFKASTGLFSKQCGVLLQNEKLRSGETPKIRIKKSNDQGYEECLVEPKPPSETIPPLLELLNREEYPEHDSLRLKLVAWMIDDKKLNSTNLQTIPKNYFLDVLVLCYLTRNDFISVMEADLILYTIKTVESDKIPKDLRIDDTMCLNEQGFKVAFLFTKYHLAVSRCLQVTGLKSLTKILNFDGVFFHKQYLKMIECVFEPTNELAEISAYRLYDD